ESPVMQRLITEKTSITQLLDREVITVLGEPIEISSDMLYSDPVQLGLIEEYIRATLDYSSLKKRLETLESANTSYQARISNLPRLNQTQQRLERQLSTTQETYKTLLRRLEDIQVQQDETINNSQLIEPAVVPTVAVSGSKSQVIALGVLVGTLLGVSTTLVTNVLTPQT
ncbi:MAG: GNVR domain-containing protein, partial [Cyanobacteria bacterium P01_C01_bin.72]